MNAITREHHKVACTLFAAATGLHALALEHVGPWLTVHHVPGWCGAAALSSSAFGMIFVGGLHLYTHHVWRRLPWNRRLCFMGRYTTTTIETVSGIEVTIASGTAEIEQTALSMRMSGRSTIATCWDSRAVSFDDNGEGYIVFVGMKRDGTVLPGHNLWGSGMFNVVSWGADGRPEEMCFHCQEKTSGGPPRMLKIVYRRILPEKERLTPPHAASPLTT